MNQRTSLLVLLLFICLAFACKKKEPVVTNLTTNYIFENTLSQPVVLRIYASGGFAGGGIIENILQPGAQYRVPMSAVENEMTYSFEWYSKDYNYGIVRDAIGVKNTFKYTEGSSEIIKLGGQPNKDRHIMYTGYGDVTVWRAVNAYNKDGVSVWDTLTAYRKRISFNFTKYQTAIYYTYGTSSTDSNSVFLPYNVYDTSSRFWCKTKDVLPNLTITNDMRGTVPLFTAATDTLYLSNTINGIAAEPYYKMAKMATYYVVE
ncbi:MAG: hypothetical protein JST82_01465 [Bacteroidetes bacterium]|nr:hypothetical protein [Bacteroidota bacterium]